MVSGARRGEAAPARRAGDRAGVPLTPIHPSGWRNVLSATGIRCPRLARSGDLPQAQTSASTRGSLEPRSPAPPQPPPRPPTKAGRAALTSFPSPGPEDSRLGRGRSLQQPDRARLSSAFTRGLAGSWAHRATGGYRRSHGFPGREGVGTPGRVAGAGVLLPERTCGAASERRPSPLYLKTHSRTLHISSRLLFPKSRL